MTDIVERLRTDVLWHTRRGNGTIAADCQEAADEIERLRKALAVIDKHSINTIRTGSKDVFDWIDDMAYVGKVALEALPAAPQPAA
jgi:hydroxypyruvate isomerase